MRKKIYYKELAERGLCKSCGATAKNKCFWARSDHSSATEGSQALLRRALNHSRSEYHKERSDFTAQRSAAGKLIELRGTSNSPDERSEEARPLIAIKTLYCD